MENNLTAYVIITLLFLFNLCILLPDFQITTIETPYPVKDEEENAMHNTVVIFSSNDSFTLKQVFYLFNTCVADIFNVESTWGNSSVHLVGLKVNLCLKTSPTGDH